MNYNKPEPFLGIFGGYDDEDLQKIERYITRNYGKYEMVFHEIMSEYIHTDIYSIPPGDVRDCHTLVSVGMGTEEMFVDNPSLSRAELVIYLSKNIEDQDIKNYAAYLVNLTKFPFRNETFFSEGHTLEFGSENKDKLSSHYDGFVFRQSRTRGGRSDAKVNLPYLEATVHFLDIIPIYREEFEPIHRDYNAFFKWIDEEYPVIGKYADVKRDKVFKP